MAGLSPAKHAVRRTQPHRHLSLVPPLRTCPISRSFFARCGLPVLFPRTFDSSDVLYGQHRWYPTSREKRARYGAPVLSEGTRENRTALFDSVKVETLSGLPSAPRGCVRPQVPVLTQTLHGMSENRDLEIESSGPIHLEKISQFWLLQIAKMTLQIKRSDTRAPAHEISVRATRRIRDDRVA